MTYLYTIGTIAWWIFANVFALSLFMVEGPSMEPNLDDGEIFLLDGYSYRVGEPQRGDVVVFNLKKSPNFYYVKRIVGLPGETVHVKSDGVYLEEGDGRQAKLGEPYIKKVLEEVFYFGKRNLDEIFAVPQGEYFVLGDNRGHSLDSRSFSDPFISKENIKGRLFYVFNDENVVSTHNGDVSFTVEIADTPALRSRGLMHVEYLPEDEGMLFIFDDEGPRSFWMKNTLIPLDMIFMDDNFKVVSIARKSEPCNFDPCPSYSSGAPAKYVLEINGGLSDELGIQEGDIFYYNNYNF